MTTATRAAIDAAHAAMEAAHAAMEAARAADARAACLAIRRADARIRRGKTITKKELAEALAEKFNLQQQSVKDMLQHALEYIVMEIGKGHRFEFRDFGILESKWRKPRRAQNPKTLAPCLVPGRRVVKFKQGRLMRNALDGKPLPAEANTESRADAADQ